MTMLCDLNYYTLQKIPDYRLEYLDMKLKKFIKDFRIKKWPLDCAQLIKKIQEGGRIPLQLGGVYNVSHKFDAISLYVEEENVYQIIFNKHKIVYPFRSSRDRRFNFTIAHELGHIVLDHVLIPTSLKTPEERYIENLEADEFAGRLLMPKQLILSCNYASREEAAKHFNVSMQALWKRLNNLQRLDLFEDIKLVCQNCGYDEISPFASYCNICGISLIDHTKGVETMLYTDGFKLTEAGKAIQCPRCHNIDISPIGNYCCICGQYLINRCTNNDPNHDLRCGKIAKGNARYCLHCGSETTFFRDKLLPPWPHAKKMLQRIYDYEDEEYKSSISDEIYLDNWDSIIVTIQDQGYYHYLYSYLHNSTAKLCDYTLFIYVHENFQKISLMKPRHRKFLRDLVRQHLKLEDLEIQVIAYENFNRDLIVAEDIPAYHSHK